jgi:hypothetical protein
MAGVAVPHGRQSSAQTQSTGPGVVMSAVMRNGRRLAAVLATASTLVAASLLVATPAHAAVLFSDDFEQPTVNVFLAGPPNAMQLPANATFNGIPCPVSLA